MNENKRMLKEVLAMYAGAVVLCFLLLLYPGKLDTPVVVALVVISAALLAAYVLREKKRVNAELAEIEKLVGGKWDPPEPKGLLGIFRVSGTGIQKCFGAYGGFRVALERYNNYKPHGIIENYFQVSFPFQGKRLVALKGTARFDDFALGWKGLGKFAYKGDRALADELVRVHGERLRGLEGFWELEAQGGTLALRLHRFGYGAAETKYALDVLCGIAGVKA